MRATSVLALDGKILIDAMKKMKKADTQENVE